MNASIRSVFAVLAGFVAANLANVGGALLNAACFPAIGAASAARDVAALEVAIAQTPNAWQALIVTLAAWALGSFAGGWLAARLAPRRPVAHALAVGALFLLGGVANNVAFPPPAWFWAATCAAFLPSAWVGGASARRRSATPPRA